MDYLEKARRVIALELAEVQRLLDRLDGSFLEAVEAIHACVENRGKVVVVGVGKSGHIGEKIAATLTSTGSPAVVLNSLNALHGDLGVVADGDVILALSSSGETDELVNILPALSRFKVRIIAMTGNPKSFLAQNSHIHLDVNVEQEACPLNLAPTSSTTVMLVLGDALAMVLLEARGFQKEDFARFHPGGRLGRTLLLKVNQIMRGKEQMALVDPAKTVREVLLRMAEVRAGLAVIIDESGALAGIFTHGDFGRHFQKHQDLLEREVGGFMTLQPVTIRSEKLAVEVLHLIEQHRIDDLLVLDEDNRPIGVVDTQDLARFRLV
ncbi:MAG: KpsF/GutQ family sugar-phosphate isomerase [Chthoniobacter sp.]|nr:KpsF/GutQ family sugar-phosphate isomerase [Chthoniobacter sp.]